MTAERTALEAILAACKRHRILFETSFTPGQTSPTIPVWLVEEMCLQGLSPSQIIDPAAPQG